MPVPDFTVRSITAAITSSAIGITSSFTTTIQCWCSLRMRFSPGRSSDGTAAPTLSHLEEFDHRRDREVGPVRDGAFQRSVPDDDDDRDEAGQKNAVEQRLDSRQGTEQAAHERGELHVSKTECLGSEYQGAGD